jgi:hypothetical protein
MPTPSQLHRISSTIPFQESPVQTLNFMPRPVPLQPFLRPGESDRPAHNHGRSTPVESLYRCRWSILSPAGPPGDPQTTPPPFALLPPFERSPTWRFGLSARPLVRYQTADVGDGERSRLVSPVLRRLVRQAACPSEDRDALLGRLDPASPTVTGEFIAPKRMLSEPGRAARGRPRANYAFFS